MRVRYLATAVIAVLLGNATAAAAQAAPHEAALVGDSVFMQMAGSLGLLQVKLGKLAERKASSPAVREFGERLVADYSATNEELAAGAKQAAYPAPVMLRQHQQILDRFSSTGGSSFDKKFMAEMLSEHGEMARLFRQEAEQGRLVSLKEMAAKLRPDVEHDLSVATETAGSLGADVTATAAAERQGS